MSDTASIATTVAQKQLVLISVLEELNKAYPPEYQNRNALAVLSTYLLGAQMLVNVSMRPIDKDALV
jgi:hypothetical protein